MMEEFQQKIDLARNFFKDFSNYIELEDFRDFLLFVLNSQVPSNILQQLGIGGGKGVINLPFNPLFNIYYQKVNLISAGALIIYVKSEAVSEGFILEKDDPVFQEHLRPNERELAFRGKEKFLIPHISDCTFLNEKNSNPITLKFDDLYYDMKSFLAIAEPNILFVRDAPSESDPDLLFAFNLMPEMPGKPDEKVLKLDILLDFEHKTRNIKFIKREEDYELKYLENLINISHSDLFKAAFSLVLHIKSFKKPYNM
ncbi:MAG: hypothetical protein BAJALOKI1v1_460021 [Promethearchaeota archaeon]|nr:MAG: hypothetical protein BAJALOKI1v1_460021 [Candidatus Lokiarchaeota archaeon]